VSVKLFSIVWLSLLVSPAFGIEWEIIGQKSKSPVHRGSLDVDLKESVGEATLHILDANKIPYVGNENGLNSILGTPTGEAAIVVVSNDTMRVYGWCFEVDGVQPDVMPGKYFFPSQVSRLRWFFAFSLYEKGEWKSYCTPAYTKPMENR